MRLVSFRDSDGLRTACLTADERLLDFGRAADRAGLPAAPFASMQSLIEAGEAGLDVARRLLEITPDDALVDPDRVKPAPPLPRPVRLRDCCLFLEHMEVALVKLARTLAEQEPDPEAAFERLMRSGDYDLKPIFRERIIYYNANHLAVSGHEEEVRWPLGSEWMDYELEWACVIASGGSDIKSADARDHIFGYTIFNDWSARDIQIPVMAVKLGPGAGKDFEGGNGLGPCIVTADELPDPYSLTMTARVNGVEWSRGSTATMHHKFEDAVVQLSQCSPLQAGEVIGSGTVLTGCGFELSRRLQPGDLIELEIEGIGILRNWLSQPGGQIEGD